MKRSRERLALLLLVLVGCGSEVAVAVDAGTADAIPPGERYLPLAVGSTWTWHVTPDLGGGTPYDKTSTVEALEQVPGAPAGTMAYRVRTVAPDGDTVSWQQDTGAAIRRLFERNFTAAQVLTSEQTYVPYKLRLDESNARLAVGASWVETYTEIATDPTTGATMTRSKSETWTVESLADPIVVGAGSYSCLRVHRVGSDVGASDKTYWFAHGVGKIKEAGNQTEELSSYTPAAP
jgi:hypothetical protein